MQSKLLFRIPSDLREVQRPSSRPARSAAQAGIGPERRSRSRRFTAASIASAVLLASVAGSPTAVGEESTETAPKITYDDHIKPIFRQHCLTCHHAGDQKGGLALDSYRALTEGGGSGEVVDADGDPSTNRLWQVVSHEDTPVMPPSGDRIPDDQLELLRQWIQGGILENSGSRAKVKKNSLAFVASGSGRPDGPAAMPVDVPMDVVVVTPRPAAVTAIACSPWAPLLAIAGQRQIALHHVDSGELLGVIPFAEGIPQSLRFSRDGAYLIVGGGAHAVNGLTAIYNVVDGQRIATVGDELDIVLDADADSSLGKVALGGPSRRLRVFGTADGEVLFDLKKHTDWIQSVAFSPDDVLIASGDRAGGLVVWETATGQIYLDLVGHKAGIQSVAWRDDSNLLASGSLDGTVKWWDMNSGGVVKNIDAHAGGVMSVAFDHQGRLVTAGKDGKATLWDAAGNRVRDFAPMPEAVLEVAISHDGKRIVYGDWNGVIINADAEQPESQLTMASNLPAEDVLLQRVDALLGELQPSWDAAQAALQQAREAADQWRSQVDAATRHHQSLVDQIAHWQATDADAAQQITRVTAEIQSLAAATRDQMDRTIATRIGHLEGTTDPAAVADSEATLAAQLTDLVAARQNLIAQQSRQSDAATRLAAVQAEVPAAVAEVDRLRAQADQADVSLADATTRHDAIAARRDQLQSRSDRLRDAIR